jgi:activating signal cointegrator complex subunit 3
MARYEPRTGNIYMTDLGRIASHFYIRHASVSTINEKLKPVMTYSEIFYLIGCCSEFESLQVRDEEVPELEALRDRYCECDLKDSLSNREGKVQVLLQV